MSDNKNDKSEDNKTIEGINVIFAIFIFILALMWFISGIAAFVAGIVCLFYNSSVQDKIIGLIFGIIAGPFYWIYYIYNLNYCNRFDNFNNKYY